jgi:prepilin-type N-terminal cleavage/methylation domain-containing protein
MSRDSARGFTLVEVLIATAILLTAIGTLIELLTMSAHAARASQQIARASALANARLEQLQSLTWTVRPDGGMLSDLTTDLSQAMPAPGGSGLAPSPAGTLDANVPGFVDFLDAAGRWLGAGDRAPPRTMYVRRWAIMAPAEEGADTDIRILQVVVLVGAVRVSASGVRVRTVP